jgi:hypothetical protein
MSSRRGENGDSIGSHQYGVRDILTRAPTITGFIVQGTGSLVPALLVSAGIGRPPPWFTCW